MTDPRPCPSFIISSEDRRIRCQGGAGHVNSWGQIVHHNDIHQATWTDSPGVELARHRAPLIEALAPLMVQEARPGVHEVLAVIERFTVYRTKEKK